MHQYKLSLAELTHFEEWARQPVPARLAEDDENSVIAELTKELEFLLWIIARFNLWHRKPE